MKTTMLSGFTTRLRTAALGLLLGLAALAMAPAAFAQGGGTAAIASGTPNPAAADAAADAGSVSADASPVQASVAADTEAGAPAFDSGNVAWMLTSTLLVLLMVVPGLALFYGGMVRSKNVLSVIMQVLVVFSAVVLLWVCYGYSAAFTEGNAFFGSFTEKAFLRGITADTDADGLPEFLFIVFQSTFAGITAALIVGAFAERVRFTAVLLFALIWVTFSYLPMVHMVWSGEGGFLAHKGVIDFAGGTVVHINAGIAGLVGAYFLGSRLGYGKEALKPHNVPFTFIGAALLWVGWFGFNAGSALEVNGVAALAFINTLLATAGAVLSWSLGEVWHKGKASMLGAASGAVAGLVAITPGAGNVGIGGALAIGLLGGLAGLWGVTGLKRLLGTDDSLDVFGVHGVCGILGALLTGVFNSPALGGPGYVADWVTASVVTAQDYSIASQLWAQCKGVGLTVVWSAGVAFVAYKLVDLLIGLRVPEEQERQGLDISSHGETAYNR